MAENRFQPIRIVQILHDGGVEFLFLQGYQLAEDHVYTEKKGRNTYFMAISGKGEDHSTIERIFGTELQVLSTQGANFYCGADKKLLE